MKQLSWAGTIATILTAVARTSEAANMRALSVGHTYTPAPTNGVWGAAAQSGTDTYQHATPAPATLAHAPAVSTRRSTGGDHAPTVKAPYQSTWSAPAPQGWTPSWSVQPTQQSWAPSTWSPQPTPSEATTPCPTSTAAPITTATPTTTVAPTTTAAPTTTVAPTTTAAPTTTVAPTTTAAPTTTVAPTTTEAPTTTATPTIPFPNPIVLSGGGALPGYAPPTVQVPSQPPTVPPLYQGVCNDFIKVWPADEAGAEQLRELGVQECVNILQNRPMLTDFFWRQITFNGPANSADWGITIIAGNHNIAECPTAQNPLANRRILNSTAFFCDYAQKPVDGFFSACFIKDYADVTKALNTLPAHFDVFTQSYATQPDGNTVGEIAALSAILVTTAPDSTWAQATSGWWREVLAAQQTADNVNIVYGDCLQVFNNETYFRGLGNATERLLSNWEDVVRFLNEDFAYRAGPLNVTATVKAYKAYVNLLNAAYAVLNY